VELWKQLHNLFIANLLQDLKEYSIIQDTDYNFIMNTPFSVRLDILREIMSKNVREKTPLFWARLDKVMNLNLAGENFYKKWYFKSKRCKQRTHLVYLDGS